MKTAKQIISMLIILYLSLTPTVNAEDSHDCMDYYRKNLQVNQSLVVYDTSGIAYKGRFIKIDRKDESVVLGKISGLYDKRVSVEFGEVDSIRVKHHSFVRTAFSLIGLGLGYVGADQMVFEDDRNLKYLAKSPIKLIVAGCVMIGGLLLGNSLGNLMGYDVILRHPYGSSP